MRKDFEWYGFLVFSNGLDTECYISYTAMLPGPAIPILSQVFFCYA
jgi:hypothetical protein